MRLFFLLLCCSGLASPLFADVQQSWATPVAGDTLVYPKKVISDRAGNVFMLADVVTNNSLSFYTVKLAPNGAIEWSRRFDARGSSSQTGTAGIGLDTNGNVYVAGTYISPGNGTRDLILLRYSSLSGTPLSTNTYNDTINGNDTCVGLAVSPNGDAFVAGYGPTGSGQGVSYLLVKYTNNVQQWVQFYNANITGGASFAADVAIDAGGNSYITGYAYFGTTPAYNMVTLKFSPTGSSMWGPVRFSGATSQTAVAVRVDGQTNVFVGGYGVTGSSGNDFLLVKYDMNGVQQWSRSFTGTGSGSEMVTDVAVDGHGGGYVSGVEAVSFQYALTTVQYSSSGATQAIARYLPASSSSYPVHSLVDSNGILYVSGTVSGGAAFTPNVTTIRFSTNTLNGTNLIDWIATYDSTNGTSQDVSYGIAGAPDGGVYAFGGLYGSNPNGFVVAKYITTNYPATFAAPVLQANKQFRFSLNSAGTGHVFQVQFSTNAGPASWYPLVSVTNNTGSNVVIDATTTNVDRRLYRAVQTQ